MNKQCGNIFGRVCSRGGCEFWIEKENRCCQVVIAQLLGSLHDSLYDHVHNLTQGLRG